MRLKKLTGILAFLVIYGTSYSEYKFGLDEILQRAKTESPEVKIEKLNLDIVKKEKDKTLKNYVLPPIKLEDSDEWKIVKRYGLGVKQFEVTMDVFEGGKSLNGYKVLKSKLAKAENGVTLSEISAQEAAVAAYFDILNAQKQIEITNNSIKALERQRERMYTLYKNGKIVPKSEYLKIEADIENSKVLNLENEQKKENIVGELARILNYPLEADLKMEDFDPVAYLKTKAHLKNEKLGKVEETVLGKNEKHDLDIAKYNVKLAQSELYPTIYTKYSHTFRERDEEGWKNVDDDRFELGFRWTFEWGGTIDDIKSKKFAYEQANIKYQDNIKGLTLEMRNQLNTVKSLFDQSQVMKKRADLLKESMKIDSMRYENKLLSTYDYLNSVNKYRTAEEDYYKVQRELVLATIKYENLYR